MAWSLSKLFLFLLTSHGYSPAASAVDIREDYSGLDRAITFVPINILKPETSANLTLEDAFDPDDPRYMPMPIDQFPSFINDFLDWIIGEIYARGIAYAFDRNDYAQPYHAWRFSIKYGSGEPLLADIRSAGEVVRDNIGYFLDRMLGWYREIVV